jgi:hypothetical protein
VVQVNFKERVRNARLRSLELDKARWAAEAAAKTIEHQPDKPTPPTLGDEGVGLDPDSAA